MEYVLLILIERLDPLHNSSSLHPGSIVVLNITYENIFKDSSFLKQFVHFYSVRNGLHIQNTERKEYLVNSRV